MSIALGFLDEVADQKDSLVYSSSHFGGRPVPLPCHAKIAARQVRCATCNSIMNLLMQVYAPDGTQSYAYHRNVYIFSCARGSCQRVGWSPSFRVLRSHCNEELSHKALKGCPQSCVVCGLHAPKRCAKCKEAWYCDKEHQMAHWSQGGHRLTCGNPDGPLWLGSPWTWPTYEIISEMEEPEDEIEKGSLKEMTELMGSSSMQADGSDPEVYEKVNGDRAFLKFQKRLSRAPEQVMRYLRTDEPIADAKQAVIWASAEDQPSPGDYDICAHCGAKRDLELQILPTLLMQLPIDHLDPNSLDWGILSVYTCTANCSGNGDYAEELLWRQEVSSQAAVTYTS